MRTFRDSIWRFINNPYFGIVIGVALIAIGTMELYDTALEQFLGIDIGAHHGIILFGAVHGLKGLGEITSGMRSFEEAGQSRKP